MANVTAANAESEMVQSMGQPLGSVFYRCWGECLTLHLKWSVYSALFSNNQDTVEVLNKAAPVVFWIIQDTLIDDVVLRLCRLTDDPKDTLSVRGLPVLVDATVRPTVEVLLNQLMGEIKPIRQLRNKRIAHYDYKLAMGLKPPALVPAPTHDELKACLRTLSAMLNTIQSHYMKTEAGDPTTTPFNVQIHAYSAQDLIDVLKQGLEVKRAWGDVEPPP